MASAAGRAARKNDERGIVMVWFGLVLIVLLGVAAFAVDLVHAYAEAQHLQNALDAGALAGAVEIPQGNQDAHNRACELLANNYDGQPSPCDNTGQFTDVSADVNGAIPNEIDLEARLKVNTFFGKVLGVDHLTVHKTASAQYDPPLAMGSPANNFGDVPEGTCPDGTMTGIDCANIPDNAKQNLFAQIVGPGTIKANGNAFTTPRCGGSTATDGCSGTTNNDFDFDATTPGSEYFSIIQDRDHAPIDVYLYDASYVNVGVGKNINGDAIDTCTLHLTTDHTGLTEVAPVVGNGQHYVQNSALCAGDQNYTNGSGDDAHMDTDYQVFRPDGDVSPFNNNVAQGGCFLNAPARHATDLSDPDAPQPHLFDLPDAQAPYFQKWFKLCTIGDGGAKGSEWILRVNTPQPDAQGLNNFSIMALSSGSANNHLRVTSRQRMPLFVQKPAGGSANDPTSFYLARVLPSPGRQRTLQLSFFDLGDTQFGLSSAGNLTIEAHNATFPDGLDKCTITTPIQGNAATQPFGPSTHPPGADDFATWGNQGSEQACSFGYGASWNGQWVSINIPIPANYTCNTTAADANDNCWIKLQIDPNGNKNVLFDATTWTARMLGSPVRLVK